MSLQEAYAQLGLPVTATLPEVRKAFRRLARKLHPDVCPRERLAETAMRFVEMKEAYDAGREVFFFRGGLSVEHFFLLHLSGVGKGDENGFWRQR